jgi:hypothetical protein
LHPLDALNSVTVILSSNVSEETTMWLIEITVAGRTITRRVPGKRRELFGIGGRGFLLRPALIRPSACR